MDTNDQTEAERTMFAIGVHSLKQNAAHLTTKYREHKVIIFNNANDLGLDTCEMM